jgi:hypothetical protein
MQRPNYYSNLMLRVLYDKMNRRLICSYRRVHFAFGTSAFDSYETSKPTIERCGPPCDYFLDEPLNGPGQKESRYPLYVHRSIEFGYVSCSRSTICGGEKAQSTNKRVNARVRLLKLLTNSMEVVATFLPTVPIWWMLGTATLNDANYQTSLLIRWLFENSLLKTSTIDVESMSRL